MLKLVKLSTYALWAPLAILTGVMVWQIIDGTTRGVLLSTVGTLLVSLAALALGRAKEVIEDKAAAPEADAE